MGDIIASMKGDLNPPEAESGANLSPWTRILAPVVTGGFMLWQFGKLLGLNWGGRATEWLLQLLSEQLF